MRKKSTNRYENIDLARLFSEIERLKKENITLKSKVDKSPKYLLVSKLKNIPLTIFSNKLSALETIVKYLKENNSLTNKQVASLVGRSEKTTSQAYISSKKKHSLQFKNMFSEMIFPVHILQNRTLSILENIVYFLHTNYGLTFSSIAKLLKRDQRTVWTTYQRALKKRVKSND